MLVVCFEFCLALPEVIHLPRGLEAVTRNWRNHDSTELSASTVPGWGIWRCTLQLQEVGTFFPLWLFYAFFFFTRPIYFFPQYFSFPPSPNTLDTYGSGNTFTLMIRWPKNLNFAGILKSSSGDDAGGRRWRTLTSSQKSGGNIFCLRRSRRAAATFSRPLTRNITREFQWACSAKAWEMKRVWWKTW